MSTALLVIAALLASAILGAGVSSLLFLLMHEDRKRVCRNCHYYDSDMSSCNHRFQHVNHDHTCPHYKNREYEI